MLSHILLWNTENYAVQKGHMIKEITFEIHFNYFPFSQIEYGSVTKT